MRRKWSQERQERKMGRVCERREHGMARRKGLVSEGLRRQKIKDD